MTRFEQYLNAALGNTNNELPPPISKIEKLLSKLVKKSRSDDKTLEELKTDVDNLKNNDSGGIEFYKETEVADWKEMYEYVLNNYNKKIICFLLDDFSSFDTPVCYLSHIRKVSNGYYTNAICFTFYRFSYYYKDDIYSDYDFKLFPLIPAFTLTPMGIENYSTE